MAYVGHVGEVANWQRAGGKKGREPEPQRSRAERAATEAKRSALHDRLMAKRKGTDGR